MQRQKRGRSASRSGRKPTPSTSFSKKKRGRTSFDVEYSSQNDSEDDFEDGFKSRRSSHPRKDTGGRSATKGSGRINEVRTSTRSVHKVSYVESESEEHDEDIKKKSHKVGIIYNCLYIIMHIPVSVA